MGNRHEEDHKKLAVLSSLLGATLFCVTPVSIRLLPVGAASISIDKAEARIGRPTLRLSVSSVLLK